MPIPAADPPLWSWCDRPPAALLHELAPPMAAFEGGCLSWASQAFLQLFESVASPGASLGALMGVSGEQSLLRGEVLELVHANGSRWRWQWRGSPAAGVLTATPLAELDSLRERLDLVQGFTRTGVFERDPSTQEGRWDATMFEIWGLTPDPAGRAPRYAQTASMMFSEDTKPGAFARTQSDPGPHRQRVRIRRPDGQVRHLNTQWLVQHDEQGRARRVVGVNTDDTEAFEIASKAARLSAELDVTLEISGIGLWRMDVVSQRVYPDRRGSDIIGVPYRAEGLSIDEARARIHPDDRWAADASAQKTLRTGEPTDMQLRYPAPGGGWRHVLLRRALLRDADGSAHSFIGVLMDVTDRVSESLRLREVERRLQSAAEAARVGLWSIGRHDKLPEWSRRTYELFGLDPATPTLPLPQWLQRCVHPEDRERVGESVMRWWKSESGAQYVEFRVVRPSDGQTRWLAVRGGINRDVAEEPRGEGVVIDITEQQLLLRQLRDAVERSHLTTRALGLGTWSSDVERQRVVWDAQMFKLRGVESPARQIEPEERRSYVHPDDRAAVVLAQNQHVRDGEPWRDEFRVVWPDGQVRWITSHSVPLRDESGRIDSRIGFNWDSTEVRRAAQALHEREMAVAENQAKSQAMSRISHELRTPLNAILGFTQLLRTAAPDTGTPQHAVWLAHVEDAARHLLALIDDVLELSRAQVGELRLACEPVALADLAAQAWPLVADMAAKRGVSLLKTELPGVARADPVRLRQVLINLLNNAIKYNRPGGQVRLSSELLASRVVLHVEDTGLGIAPERLQEVFEPFNRLDAEGSAIEGSGIGLSIVKVLVQHMGGTIRVRSERGVGSVFSVDLPLAGQAPAPRPSAADARDDAPPALASAHVLYIEDNPVNALLVRELLAQQPGVTLYEADTGRAGIALAAEHRPDVVLIDMLLPDLDGIEVLQALRADPATAGLTCIALSANATSEDQAAARAAGFNDYWTKPIDFRRFVADLGHAMARDARRGA